LGYNPPQLVEHRLTHEQLELQWYWLQQSKARDQRIAEATVARGVYKAHTGKDP
jgi:hypothetical protein